MYSFDTNSPHLSRHARRAIARIEGAGQIFGDGFAVARDLLLTDGRVAQQLGHYELEAVFAARNWGEILSIPVVEVVWRGGANDCVCMVRLQRPLPDIQSVLSMGCMQRTFIAGHPDPRGAEDDGGALTELRNEVVMHRPSLVQAGSGAPVLDQDENAVGIYLVHGEDPERCAEAMPLESVWPEVEAEVRRSWERYGGPVAESAGFRGRPPPREEEDEKEDEDDTPSEALFMSFDPQERGVDEVLRQWPPREEETLAPAEVRHKERFVFTFDLEGPELIFHCPEGSRPVRAYGNVVVNHYDPRQGDGYFVLYFLGTAADGRPLEFEGEYLQEGRRLMFASQFPGEDLLVAIPCTMGHERPAQHFAFTLHALSPDGERRTYDPVVLNVPISGSFGESGPRPPASC